MGRTIFVIAPLSTSLYRARRRRSKSAPGGNVYLRREHKATATVSNRLKRARGPPHTHAGARRTCTAGHSPVARGVPIPVYIAAVRVRWPADSITVVLFDCCSSPKEQVPTLPPSPLDEVGTIFTRCHARVTLPSATDTEMPLGASVMLMCSESAELILACNSFSASAAMVIAGSSWKFGCWAS
jgi:hypothetical protein